MDILVSHEDGIELIVDGAATTVLSGRAVTTALPDLSGGVVFREATDPWFATWPPQPAPIEWIPAIGAGPEILVDAVTDEAGYPYLRRGEWLVADRNPIRVSWVEGRRQLLYRRTLVIDSLESQIGQLVLRDLDSGAERVLGTPGGYEASTAWIDVAGGAVAFGWEEFDTDGACAGVASLDALLALAPDDLVGNICDGECCAHGRTPGCGLGIACASTGGAWLRTLRVAMSADGSVLVVGETSANDEGEIEGHEVTEFSVATGEVLRRTAVPVEAGEYEVIVPLDHDGERVLAGIHRDISQTRRLVLIDEEGSVRDLGPLNWASFWPTEPAPLAWLGEEGIGVVDFGTPVDEAMATMTAIFGVPIGTSRGRRRGQPEPCHAASGGYGCVEYLRNVGVVSGRHRLR